LETPDLSASGPSEIRFLEQSLNSMKASLKDRIEALDENAKLEKKIHQQELQQVKVKRELDRARLLTLQAQINPHFLFNAMNTISRTALFEDAEQTSDLVTDLAGIFRYMLDQRTTVPLYEELEFIQKYLKIQKIRFGERLDYEIEAALDVQDILIPPLIIQPLVENSIVHGLEPLEEGGTVHIVLELIKKRLFITIGDTGVGIADSDKSQVLESTAKTDNSHIGMANVLERITLYYGKSAKMEIEQAQPRGTVVRLTLPIRRQDRLGG
jgi:sensor histidine kinase YesM